MKNELEFKNKLIEYLNQNNIPYEDETGIDMISVIIMGYKIKLRAYPDDHLMLDLQNPSHYFITQAFTAGMKEGKNSVRADIKRALNYE